MTSSSGRRWALGAAAAAAATVALLAPIEARASGLYFTDRGVRPLGRGGAFVAGADDLGAIWYNPAGLVDAGTSILVDASWLHFTSEFTRMTQVPDSQGTLFTYTYPTVAGSTPVLPIPTIGASFAFGENKEYVLAVGLLAPYTAIASYPLTLADGTPSPSRYSLVSLDGSALVETGAWFAFKPIEELRLGAGLEFLTGTFKSTEVFSASPPDRLISTPEDPNYDAFAQLKVGPIFAPSANIGVTYVASKIVRFGMSAQAPFHIDAPATVNVKLPTAVEFDNAYQSGTDAHVAFDLPATFRAGVEVRPLDALRVEATYVREFWSEHKNITITPDNIQLYGVTGFPSPFAVSTINLPRNFQDSNSFRVGGEYMFDFEGYKIQLRGGIDYEQSAIPNAYLSPLTIDLDKVIVALGGGIYIGKHWRFDAVYAHAFASDATVSPSEAAVPRVNPVQGNPTATEAINGGQYSARADVLGIGLNYKF
jgi:long-chain fatty acid transport protein